MNVYFNELSLNRAFSIDEAKKWAHCFFSVILELKKIAPKSTLITTYPSIEDFNFFNDICLRNILLDYREYRMVLINFLTYTEPVYDIPEYRFNDQECLGMGLAYKNGTMSFSIPSSVDWEKPEIKINSIDFNKNLQEILNELQVKNVSIISHLDYHKNFIRAYSDNELRISRSKIECGKYLWENRGEIFPNLWFNSNIQDFLLTFGSTNYILKDIILKLDSINSAINSKENLNSNIIRNKILGNPRPETPHDLEQYGDKLIFDTPKGKLQFSFHIDFHIGVTSSRPGGRIYYHPNFENRICYIGYIGEHP